MAIAKKCDRCGKLHEYYSGNTEFKNSERANGVLFIDRDLDNKYWSLKSYDLCVDCMRKLEAFIKNEEDNANDQNLYAHRGDKHRERGF